MRAVFVYNPHMPHRSRLDTMPFATNVLNALLAGGASVELLLWEPRPTVENRHPRLTVRSFEGPRLRRRVRWLGFLAAQLGRRHDLVVGVGKRGICLAADVATLTRASLVYLSDELPSAVPADMFTRRHPRAARRAAVIAVPDIAYAAPLREELRLPGEIPILELPNAPVTLDVSSTDWRAALGLSAHAHYFLHSGSLHDHFQLPEIMTSVPAWPPNAVLVVNGRAADEIPGARAALSHLDVPGRILWTGGQLAERELHALTRGATGSFALYRATNENMRLVGASSGKLARSLALGTPVIASRLPSLEFVETSGVGFCVRHPAEIPKAVEALITSADDIRDRCRAFYRTRFSFEPAWRSVLERAMRKGRR